MHASLPVDGLVVSGSIGAFLRLFRPLRDEYQRRFLDQRSDDAGPDDVPPAPRI